MLYGGTSVVSPCASQLAPVLRACSGLVRLGICYQGAGKEAVPSDTSPIELHALIVLDMDLSSNITTYILAVVHIPACETFRVTVWNPKPTFLPDALRHHTSTLVSRITSTPLTVIIVSDQAVSYQAGGAVLIHLIYPVSRMESLNWIVGHIHPSAPSVPTRLSIYATEFPLSALTTRPLASSVYKLTVCDKHHSVRFLSQPVTVDGVRRFPFPNLRELVLGSKP